MPELTAGEPFEMATRVAEGVWAIPMPFPSPLTHVYAYVVRHADGATLIDAGWDSDEAWDALLAGLRRAEVGLPELRSVLITHIHPDHYGLVGRLRDHADVKVQMHPLEASRIQANPVRHDEAIDDMVSWLEDVGAPEDEIDALRSDAARIKSRFFTRSPDIQLEDGAIGVDAGGMQAVHTPGHTPGHLAFHDPDRELLFTGDHVLPRITPNVSKRPENGADPLGDFVASLRKVKDLPIRVGLPGHEWPMPDLQGRLESLLTHHDDRMLDVERAVRSGAATVWEVATSIRWSRPWSQLQGLSRRSAIGEAHAHLERLAREGRLERTFGPPSRWSVTG